MKGKKRKKKKKENPKEEESSSIFFSFFFFLFLLFLFSFFKELRKVVVTNYPHFIRASKVLLTLVQASFDTSIGLF